METGSNPAEPGVPPPARTAGVLRADLGRSLARWAAEARVDDDAARRVRAHWQRVAAEHDATFAGTLLRLAERSSTATLHTVAHRVVGVVVGVGVDFVAVRTTAEEAVLVRIDGIEAVGAAPDDRRVVAGDVGGRLDVDLASVLGPVAAERPDVVVRTASVTVHGTLRSAGRDVLALWRDGERREPVWVPTAKAFVLTLR